MFKPESFAARWIVGNPLYVISAAVMMAGIATVLNRPGQSAGDVPHILSAYGALQLYEAALLGMAAWILMRLLVPEDGITLLGLECLFLGGAFITLDELLAADTSAGLGLAGAGLVFAAAKLGLARRPMGIPIGWLPRGLALAFIALPIAWVPWMKFVVDEPVRAAWAAYGAWMSLAVGLLAVLLLIGLGALRLRPGASAAASIVLGLATVLTVGGHFFSLHHAFLAPSHVWYPVPASMVIGAIAAWAVLVKAPGLLTRDLLVSFTPAAPMLLLYLDSPVRVWPWYDLPPVLQPLHLAGWWLVLVYTALVLLTRRKILALPLAAAGLLAVGERREVAFEFASDRRGWCLVGLAFVTLALGGWLTAYRHRRRAVHAVSRLPIVS